MLSYIIADSRRLDLHYIRLIQFFSVSFAVVCNESRTVNADDAHADQDQDRTADSSKHTLTSAHGTHRPHQ